jgi:hypothetical protein
MNNEEKLGNVQYYLRANPLSTGEGDPEIILSPVDSEETFPVTDIFKVSDRDLMFHLPSGLAAGDYRVRLLIKRGLTLLLTGKSASFT